MTATTATDLDVLRARMAERPWAASCPATSERLGLERRGSWPPSSGTGPRALLARAVERSPFHAERGCAAIDPGRFELADLPRLPVMAKAQMMADFDAGRRPTGG